ncbi:MAG: MBL fold metallo-hydrolase [Acidobacteriota bacterium]
MPPRIEPGLARRAESIRREDARAPRPVPSFRTLRAWCATLAVAIAATLFHPAHAQQPAFRVVLLGTGTPAPLTDRLGPSILVEAGVEKLIVDVGRDVVIRLDQVGIPFSDITGILFTHLHADHVSGLPDLWLTGRFAGRGRSASLDVWGPAGTQNMISHLAQAYQFDLSVRPRLTPQQGALAPHEIEDGVVFSRNGVTVSAFAVDHVPPSFGYRIDYGGRSVVLSGDTRVSPRLIEKSAGVDLLVHEVAATAPSMATADTARIMSLHVSPEEAGTIFSKVRPKLAVYSHIVTFGVPDEDLVSRTRTTYSGPLVVGTDLMSFDIGDAVTMKRWTPK